MSTMTIQDCKNLIRNTANKHGFSEFADIPVRVNNRLSRCLGRACFNDDGSPEEIQLSGVLLKNATNEDVKQVCLHELCHFMTEKAYGPTVRDHGPEFKRMCRRLGCTHTGATNHVTWIEPQKETIDDRPYVLKCTCCGNTWRFKTECKRIKHPELYTCSCGGALRSYKAM